jgi:hypothetical protein
MRENRLPADWLDVMGRLPSLRAGVIGGGWQIGAPGLIPYGGAPGAAFRLAALRLGQVRLLTALGDDPASEHLRAWLDRAGVDVSGVWQEAGWRLPAAGDFRAAGLRQQVLSVEGEMALLSRLDPPPQAPPPQAPPPENWTVFSDLDVLVIVDPGGAGPSGADDATGILTPRVLAALNAVALHGAAPRLLVDSPRRPGVFDGMSRKLFPADAARWLFPKRDPDAVGLDDFASAALVPQVECGCPQFILLDAGGCLVVTEGESHFVPALPHLSPKAYRAGSGEAFLVGAAAALAAGENGVEAAQLGFLAAAAMENHLGIPGADIPQAMLALTQ